MCVCVSFGCENFSQVISVSEWYIYIYMWSFQQGWPFIFSLPLQRGNREPVWRHTEWAWTGPPALPSSPPRGQRVQHSLISGVWAGRGTVPSFTKVPVSCWWSQKERQEGLRGWTKPVCATERGLDRQQQLSWLSLSQPLRLAFCQPRSEKAC